MPSLDTLPDTCSADEAASLIAALAPTLGIQAGLPDVRTLRLWRSKKLLTIDGRRFVRRNLLEVLVSLQLRQDGLTPQSAFQRAVALDDVRLRMLLSGTTEMPMTRSDSEALITLHLLAKGIVEQYRWTRKGAVVGHTDAARTGTENTPLSLHQAMARLGRHYFVEGKEDRAASIHQLLALCTTPLSTWAPQALADLDRYRDAVLIDPAYRVPNEDCEAIAEEAEGTNLSDLVEHHLHEGLRRRLQKLGADADAAYTIVREFVGRHPMATAGELQRLYSNPELNDEVIRFVHDDLYIPVHADVVSGAKVRRCAYCKALIFPKDGCVLAGCRADHETKDAVPVPLNEAYLARPEVLKYWADPAREELRLYDELCRVRQLRDRVHLYPHSDWCDVSVGEEVGVDVKDYHDPVRLAQRMNRHLGNLGHYPERILAIARRRWTVNYRERLMEQLSSERRATLEVMSLDDTITYLKARAKRGSHARQA